MNSQVNYTNYGYATITANAARTPDKIAIKYQGESITFAQTNDRVNRVANALSSLQLGRGSRIASLIKTPIDIAELYLAEAKIGAVIVALNPYWEPNVLLAVTQNADVDCFVYQECHRDLIAFIQPQLPMIKHWVLVGDQTFELPLGHTRLSLLVDAASTIEPQIGATANDPMAIFFTSGTTGLPKPVVHTHLSCRSMAEIWFDLPHADDSVWGTGPIVWGIGFPCTMGAALFAGMTVSLEKDFGPQGFLSAVPTNRISHCCLLPSFWSDLFANYAHDNIDLSSLKMILLGGEPLHQTLLEKIKRRVPQAKLFGFYGQTEAPFACIGPLQNADDIQHGPTPRLTCAAKVVNSSGHRVIDAVGELALTGPNQMQYYDKLSAKTAETLRDGWFYSGDLAVQDSHGHVRIIGRNDDVIRRQGRVIKPNEIEEAALQFPNVYEAVALGYPEQNSEQRILLILSVANSRRVTETAVQQFLQSHLPIEYLPDRIIIADEFEHSNDGSGGKGKLLRNKIRERYREVS